MLFKIQKLYLGRVVANIGWYFTYVHLIRCLNWGRIPKPTGNLTLENWGAIQDYVNCSFGVKIGTSTGCTCSEDFGYYPLYLLCGRQKQLFFALVPF